MPDSKIRTTPPESMINKYEMVVVAGREARRLNELAHQQGRELKGRVTDIAMRRYLSGEVKYRYEAPPTPPALPPTT